MEIVLRSNTSTRAAAVFCIMMSSAEKHDLVLWPCFAWQHHGHLAVITITLRLCISFGPRPTAITQEEAEPLTLPRTVGLMILVGLFQLRIFLNPRVISTPASSSTKDLANRTMPFLWIYRGFLRDIRICMACSGSYTKQLEWQSCC